LTNASGTGAFWVGDPGYLRYLETEWWRGSVVGVALKLFWLYSPLFIFIVPRPPKFKDVF
jgi:hypothetical protein